MSNDLVSVIISTYNSSRFIMETIESVSIQTWKNIELIITDDCSSDNTVEICRKWIDSNRQKFIKSQILTSEINTGVSANANRGLKKANGEWIKFLGGDDTLAPECISDNMRFVNGNPVIKVLFSKINIYQNTFEESNLTETIPKGEINQNSIFWPARSVESQYRMLLVSDRINFTPSVFLCRDVLLSVGGFDERFKLLEDYPLWLNLTKIGHKLYFMDKTTVNYRKHTQAINNTGISYLVNPNYLNSNLFRKVYTYPYLPAEIRYDQQFTRFVSRIFRWRWLNKNTIHDKIILDVLTLYLNPFKYFIWLKKKLIKNLKYNEFYSQVR